MEHLGSSGVCIESPHQEFGNAVRKHTRSQGLKSGLGIAKQFQEKEKEKEKATPTAETEVEAGKQRVVLFHVTPSS